MIANDPVVISGLGVVSPIGISIDEFTQALQTGRSGFGPIGSFCTQNLQVKNACEVNPKALVTKLSIMDPAIQYALRATEEALKDAKFNPENENRERIGITVSSSKGGLTTFEQANTELHRRGGAKSTLQSARAYANLAPNMSSQWIARTYKIKGPAECPVAACATGAHSVIAGVNQIQDGRADVCIVGATEACITPFALSAYHQMGVYATGRLRPYDQNRNGFVIGEGAGVLILEKLSSAKKRNAPVYAAITATDWSSDAFHPVHFNPEGDTLARSIEETCKRAGILPQNLDYVNTHGTGTEEGDSYELAQLDRVFGADSNVSFSSIKAMTGHMIGASGAVEIIACCLAMKKSFIPPTMHIEQLDPACRLDVTPNQAKSKTVNRALSFSLGFGGHVGTVMLEKVTSEALSSPRKRGSS